MSPDMTRFCKAMEGLWEVIKVEQIEGNTVVTHRSLDDPDLTWSLRPYHPEMVCSVGVRGRIGFIGLGMKPKDA